MNRSRRFFDQAFAAAAIGLVMAAAPAALAQSGESGDAQTYQAIVTSEELDVRSGAGTTYYPFARLERGDIITVIGERFGWARVRTEGPAFAEGFAYIKASELRLSQDGTAGLALGRVQVLAPNMLRDGDPESSWKWITRLEPEKTVRVLGSVASGGGGGETYCKVTLPEDGEGWVSINFIRRATNEEIAQWKARAAAARTAPKDGPAEASGANASELSANQPSDPRRPVQIIDTSAEGATSPNENTFVARPDEESPTVDDLDASSVNAGSIGESDDVEIAAPDATEQALSEVTLEDLEAAYEGLTRVSVREAEIEPLRDRYQAYLEAADLSDRQRAIAAARVALLDARLELQQQMLELDRVRSRAELNAETAEQVRIAIEHAEAYTAIGIVTASTIYDGVKLPLMLRLVDPGSGRTIAYLAPHRFDFGQKIGQLVGIKGEKEYDGGMRLTIITPRRVDMLTAVE